MNDQTIWQRHPQAVSAEVGDEVIFLHETDGVYYSLDGVGAFVWQCLANPLSYGELVGRVLDEYEVPEADLRKDLEALAEDLQARSLVETQG